jgi:hypothetical protein
VDRPELLRVVERVRIEMVYARSTMRRFVPAEKAGDPDPEQGAVINRVGVSISKISDAIREAENLIEILR